jgi:hypothetical protein
LHELVVGEIGMPRHDFLWEMAWWEILSVVRGYRKRCREWMVMTRWQTLVLCNTWGAKFERPTDLLEFNWERERKEEVSDDEINEMRRKIQEINENSRKS